MCWIGLGGGGTIAKVPLITFSTARVAEVDGIGCAAHGGHYAFGDRIVGMDGEAEDGIVAKAAFVLVGPHIGGGGEGAGTMTAGTDTLVEGGTTV